MGLKQQDYNTARQNYEFEYNKAVQLQQIMQSNVNTQTDNARANLSVITSTFEKSGLAWEELSFDQQSFIQQLEMQAGFPVGISKQFMESNPGVEVKWTNSSYDSAGNEVLSFFGVDKSGNPTLIKTLPTGGVKEATKATETEKDLAEVNRVFSTLIRGQGGYVNLADFQIERSRSRLSASDFNNRFGYMLSPGDQIKEFGISAAQARTETEEDPIDAAIRKALGLTQ